MTPEELEEFDRNCMAAVERLQAMGLPAASLVTPIEEWVINHFRGHTRSDEIIPLLRRLFGEARQRVEEIETNGRKP